MDGSAQSDSPYSAIYAVVSQIPPGRVCTYGRVAALAGLPGQARLVGYALHALLHHSVVPWWRVINRAGRISNVYAADEQRARLQAEGVVVDDNYLIDLARFLWEGDEA
ncbi:MGMT family protein [Chloroflexus sp.]|uniref:MGMT family protein n=1 Tax=Chloroflexus sp. TaxID=1904827 RepID=UPI002607C372|nr:MGMT family protein [uncultured Chloroflexus sp.]